MTPVDIQLGIGNTSTSGCEPADFTGFPAGNIALIQRGMCTFELKAENAAAAGAVGVCSSTRATPRRRPQRHPGRHPRQRLHRRHPGAGPTYALGAELSPIAGLEMRLFANSAGPTRATTSSPSRATATPTTS